MTDKEKFAPVFASLREILVPFSNSLSLEIDEVDQFFINTNFIMKNKKPMYFASVKINKSYVSYHLMPVYVFPDLLNQITPELKCRMQGKSCFNFSHVDTMLFEELGELTKSGYSEYEKAGYL